MRSNMHSSPDMLIKHTFPVCENGVGGGGGPCEDTAVKCLECQSEWAWRWHFHFTRQAQNWNIQISQNEKRWHTRKIPNKMSTCKEKKIRGLLAITSDFYIICKVLPPACPTQSPECLGHLPPKMSHHKACGQISLGLVPLCVPLWHRGNLPTVRPHYLNIFTDVSAGDFNTQRMKS